LLPANDGWVALNLARVEDWDMLPALFETDQAVRTEDELSDHVSRSSAEDLVNRGRLMGLPMALLRRAIGRKAAWYHLVEHGASAPVPRPSRRSPLVVDLSSLWAGPLATHLLQQAGARVIKVESTTRPDGARAGAPAFFDLLNCGKESVSLDLTSTKGRQQLGSLLSHADIVMEASRPRALAQMGIHAEALVKSAPGRIWVSITGYGRGEPESRWVAWGDDAAVAAGAFGGTLDAPVFCGDALADPLTGLHAGLAALAFWQGGESVLLDLSLCEVTAHAVDFAPHTPKGSVFREEDDWYITVEGHTAAVMKPEERTAQNPAATLGAQTRSVLEEFDIPC
jgi:crotonobetainyl-CoA:carnitine CoA-transferase CaiB-like acyl-CoA transferase